MSENLLSGGGQAILSFPKTAWNWFRKDFIWPLLCIPFLFALLMFLVFDNALFGSMVDGEWKTWSETRRWKDIFEIVHPALLALGAFLGFLGMMKYRRTAFVFLGILCAFALFREIAGQGWTVVLYGGILILIFYSQRNPEKLDLLHKSRWTLSFVGMVFFCYALSQLLDRGLVKRLAKPFTETNWPPYSSYIEESLESLGGFFLVLAVLSLFFLVGKSKDQKQ